MDPMMAEALKNALKKADYVAGKMTEGMVAGWKDPAPANARTMTRNKLRKFIKKKKAWAENEM